MAKPVVFLDTSVLIAALLSSTGGSSYILNSLNADFIFLTNKYALGEVHNAIVKKFADIPELWTRLFLLLGVSGMRILKNPSDRQINLVKPIISAKDAPILASAFEDSDILLTLDNEFFGDKIQAFAGKQNLSILKPKVFIEDFRRRARI